MVALFTLRKFSNSEILQLYFVILFVDGLDVTVAEEVNCYTSIIKLIMRFAFFIKLSIESNFTLLIVYAKGGDMHITMPVHVLVIIQMTGHYIIKSRKRASVNVTKHNNNYDSYVLTITTMYLKECGLLLNKFIID